MTNVRDDFTCNLQSVCYTARRYPIITMNMKNTAVWMGAILIGGAILFSSRSAAKMLPVEHSLLQPAQAVTFADEDDEEEDKDPKKETKEDKKQRMAEERARKKEEREAKRARKKEEREAKKQGNGLNNIHP